MFVDFMSSNPMICVSWSRSSRFLHGRPSIFQDPTERIFQLCFSLRYSILDLCMLCDGASVRHRSFIRPSAPRWHFYGENSRPGDGVTSRKKSTSTVVHCVDTQVSVYQQFQGTCLRQAWEAVSDTACAHLHCAPSLQGTRARCPNDASVTQCLLSGREPTTDFFLKVTGSGNRTQHLRFCSWIVKPLCYGGS